MCWVDRTRISGAAQASLLGMGRGWGLCGGIESIGSFCWRTSGCRQTENEAEGRLEIDIRLSKITLQDLATQLIASQW